MSIATETNSNNIADEFSFREALLPKKRPGAFAYFIWILSLIFALFQFFIQLSAGEIIGGLMKSFNITAFGAGMLASASYYIYVMLQTPAGVLIDKYGPRKLLTLGSFLLMLGCFLFGVSHELIWAFVGRLLMGLGAAFAFVGSLYLLDKWFPRERFALMTGIVEMVAMLGTLVGAFWLAHYVELFGWRHCMYFSAVFSGFLSLLLGVFVRDFPANRAAIKPNKEIKRRVLPGLRVLVRMKIAWINGVYSGIMFALISVFAALWGIPYVQQAHHLSLVQATFYCSLVYVGVSIFAPLLGWLDTRITHRRYVMFSCAILGFFCTTVIIFWPSMPLVYLSVAMTLVGVASSGYVLTFAVANQIAALRIRSASIGFVNMLSIGGTPVLQPLIGLSLFLLASYHHASDMRHYTIQEYQLSLMIMPLSLFIAAWLSWLIPSRK